RARHPRELALAPPPGRLPPRRRGRDLGGREPRAARPPRRCRLRREGHRHPPLRLRERTAHVAVGAPHRGPRGPARRDRPHPPAVPGDASCLRRFVPWFPCCAPERCSGKVPTPPSPCTTAPRCASSAACSTAAPS